MPRTDRRPQPQTSRGTGTNPAHPGRPAPEHRRDTILQAAYAVFVRDGFGAATTLAIAREAKASKETVYQLFGSKEELFAALIRWRADRMQAPLAMVEQSGMMAEGQEFLELAGTLTAFGVEFLTLLTLPSTIEVHRMAIAEAGRTPRLGQLLHEVGRAPTAHRVSAYLAQAAQHGLIEIDDARDAAGTFFALLKRDILDRLLLGLETQPDQATLRARAAHATEQFLALVSPKTGLSHRNEPDGPPAVFGTDRYIER